ncbi:MAG TPA: lantibiotic dehydratase [Herpetosiphonaceae bacterium]
MNETEQTQAETEDEAGLPSHLMPLVDEQWAVWRWAGLRGAGFPAAQVLSLAASSCAASADRLLAAEQAVDLAEERAAAMVNAALDALQQAEQWHDSARRDPLVKLLRAIRKRKPPQSADVAPEIAEAVQAFRAAQEQAGAALTDYQVAYQAGVAEVAAALRAVAGDPRFQEALIWQNRQAYHTGVLPLQQADPAVRGSRQRQHEELIANYVQRYCAKNDTIGFFGPVGWAQFADDGPAIAAEPGPDLLAARSVYFEGWCVDALAKKLAANKALLPWSAPRRIPALHAEGSRFFMPFEGEVRLSVSQVAALQTIDGQRTAHEIAQLLLRTPSSAIRSEVEAYETLRQLRDRGLIAWDFALPLELRPERTLQRLLARIGNEPLRRQVLAAIDQFDAARAAVARAAGNPARLDRAMSELETFFTRLTGSAPSRAAGKMYAARTLVYEDCRRDIEVRLGPELRERLGPPLGLLLTSSRWFTYHLAQGFRVALQDLYAELSRQAGSSAVEMVAFWLRAQTLLFDDTAGVVEELSREFQQRWAEILALPEDQRVVTYSCAELLPRVQAAFDAPRAGWRSARHHSPDILIAAESVEAIGRGEYQLVMGEMHTAMNTLGGLLFVGQHPAPEQLYIAAERDLAEPSLVPIYSRNLERVTTRTRPGLISSKDYRLTFAHDSVGAPKLRELPIGSLVVEDLGQGIVLRTRDGKLQFDLIDTFALILSILVVNNFRIVEPAAHRPRIFFDDLVVNRESWRFDPADLSFANETDEAARFLAARRWARAHAMPRFVFVKLPIEVKPFYVDFDSPVYVNILARLVRRIQTSDAADRSVTVVEMLPRLDQAWLPDAEGRRYTSELRIVALDLNP